jgi:hypothetical protein
MTENWRQMRWTKTVEVRLDQWQSREFRALRGQSNRLFGCYPVGCEQILLPRGSQGRKIRSDKLGIRGMSVKPARSAILPRSRLESGECQFFPGMLM